MLNSIIDIAINAGNAILEIYNQDFEVEIKSDNSPLTLADKTANDIIVKGLQTLDNTIPIISEENKLIEYQTRKNWTKCWMVDPLDGTTNFIHGLPLFCISLALEYQGEIVVGIIHVPQLKQTYTALKNEGAYLNAQKISVSTKTELKNAFVVSGFVNQSKNILAKQVVLLTTLETIILQVRQFDKII